MKETVLPWWSVLAANLVAGVAVGGYLIRSHRTLIKQLEEMAPEGL